MKFFHKKQKTYLSLQIGWTLELGAWSLHRSLVWRFLLDQMAKSRQHRRGVEIIILSFFFMSKRCSYWLLTPPTHEHIDLADLSLIVYPFTGYISYEHPITEHTLAQDQEYFKHVLGRCYTVNLYKNRFKVMISKTRPLRGLMKYEHWIFLIFVLETPKMLSQAQGICNNLEKKNFGQWLHFGPIMTLEKFTLKKMLFFVFSAIFRMFENMLHVMGRNKHF